MFKEKLNIPGLVLIAVALFSLGCLCFFGPYSKSLLEFRLFDYSTTFGFRLDVISVAMTLMITFISLIIINYSASYLAHEKQKQNFHANLYFTSYSACLMVLSADLFFSVFFWFMASLGMNRLLLFFEVRPKARLAARKKFYVSRFGDLFLMLGVALCWANFGGTEYERLFSLTNQIITFGDGVAQVEFIFAIIAVGVLIKTVQFPFHFWLPETMETPSVVSALMHAGIVNAGGILLVRMAPIYAHLSASSAFITIVGATTAVFGALSMSVQNDIKRKLAYSTISQMGIMMFACGLGLYSVALFHILVHSFYKAYAFLTTGNLIEESRSAQATTGNQGLVGLLVSLGILGSGLFFGLLHDHGTHAGYWLYFSIILAGLVDVNLLTAFMKMTFKESILLVVKMALLVTLVFAIEHAVTLEILGEHILQSLNRTNLNIYDYTSVVLGTMLFSCGFVVHFALHNAEGRYQARIYYMLNGHSRLNQLFNALIAKSEGFNRKSSVETGRSRLNPIGGANV